MDNVRFYAKCLITLCALLFVAIVFPSLGRAQESTATDDIYDDIYMVNGSLMSPFGLQNMYFPIQTGTGLTYQVPFLQIAPLLGVAGLYNSLFPNLFNATSTSSSGLELDTTVPVDPGINPCEQCPECCGFWWWWVSSNHG